MPDNPSPSEKILPTRDTAIAVRPESIPTPAGKTERRDLRSANSKTFLHAEKAPDGKEIRTCHVQLGAVCYRDDNGELRSIDTTVRQLDHKTIGVEWAPYVMTLHQFGIGFDFMSRDGGMVKLTLSGIGGEKFDQLAELKPDITDNIITFRDVRPGCDIVFKCLNDRVKTLRILHDATAPRTFDWRFWSDKPELIDDRLTGTDAAGNQLELASTIDGDLIIENWSGITQNDADVVYPVEIDPTVTVNPAADNDDGYQWIGTFDWINSNINFGSISGTDLLHAGVRFPNVTVPQGSTVSDSTLGLYSHTVTGSGGSGTIYGYNADNPSQYSSGNKVSDAARTSASMATGSIGTTGQKTWTVTTVAQEIVNRGGYASGNAISMMVIGNLSGNDRTRFYDKADGSNQATLSITYTAGGGGGTSQNLLLLGCG